MNSWGFAPQCATLVKSSGDCLHPGARAAAPPQRPGGGPMKIPKPTEADRERFTGLVPDAPHVEIKPMFGNLGAFVNGNMFMGLFGSDVGIKLPEDDQQRLLAEPGAGPFGPEERPMAGYVAIPARSEEHTSELQSRPHLVCRLLLEKKKKN